MYLVTIENIVPDTELYIRSEDIQKTCNVRWNKFEIRLQGQCMIMARSKYYQPYMNMHDINSNCIIRFKQQPQAIYGVREQAPQEYISALQNYINNKNYETLLFKYPNDLFALVIRDLSIIGLFDNHINIVVYKETMLHDSIEWGDPKLFEKLDKYFK